MNKQNVVLILMDTARFPAVSAVRESQETFVGSLADQSTEYTNAFATAPWSLPSHASLFTSCYASKHGAHAGHKRLDNDQLLLPEIFQREGYETVCVSNNTWISEEFGFGSGFDTFEKTWQYFQSDIDLGQISRTEEGLDKITALGRKLLNGNPIINFANALYGQFFRRQHDDGAKRTNEWINGWLTERSSSKPFFLFVNYLEPHLEYRPPEEFASDFLPTDISYNKAMQVSQDAFGYITGNIDITDRDFKILRALYRAEIAYLDHRISELKDCLADHDEWEDTIFIISGDHGENIGDHGLMDHQYCLYDTLLHVPLIIHGGSFTEGGINSNLVQLTDIGPTLLDEIEVEAPEYRKQAQGKSFHPKNTSEGRNRIIAEYLSPQPSMEALKKRVGKVPESVYQYDRSLRTIRKKEWKLIRGSDGSHELYHLQSDPTESNNIANQNIDIVEDLGSELDQWVDSFKQNEKEGDVAMREKTKKRLEDLGYIQ